MAVIKCGQTTNSGASTGTGSAQTVTHGLPTVLGSVQFFVPSTGELMGAIVDATNIYPNVTNGVVYNWLVVLQ